MIIKPAEFTEAGPTGELWDVVTIREGWSKNGRYYSRAFLEDALSRGLFDGAPVGMWGDEGHHRGGLQGIAQRAGTVVGFIDQPRLQETEGRLEVVNRFRCTHSDTQRLLLESWKAGKRNLLGFSIHAGGQAFEGMAEGRRGLIAQRMDTLGELTLVRRPAAHGRFQELVASADLHVSPEVAALADQQTVIDNALMALRLSETDPVLVVSELKAIQDPVPELAQAIRELEAGSRTNAEKLLQAALDAITATLGGFQEEADAELAEIRKEAEQVELERVEWESMLKKATSAEEKALAEERLGKLRAMQERLLASVEKLFGPKAVDELREAVAQLLRCRRFPVRIMTAGTHEVTSRGDKEKRHRFTPALLRESATHFENLAVCLVGDRAKPETWRHIESELDFAEGVVGILKDVHFNARAEALDATLVSGWDWFDELVESMLPKGIGLSFEGYAPILPGTEMVESLTPRAVVVCQYPAARGFFLGGPEPRIQPPAPQDAEAQRYRRLHRQAELLEGQAAQLASTSAAASPIGRVHWATAMDVRSLREKARDLRASARCSADRRECLEKLERVRASRVHQPDLKRRLEFRIQELGRILDADERGLTA